MKKRTELKFFAALACFAGLTLLCSGSEAIAQQRFKDALYSDPSSLSHTDRKGLDVKTDSLIARTQRLQIFQIGKTEYSIQLPADIKIRIYEDPRDFLYDHSNLSWFQIDRIFWRGPWAYYGPYGAFGPYNRTGWGYSNFYGCCGYRDPWYYMPSYAYGGYWMGGMYGMTGYGFNGLADYPFYGGMYDLAFYDYAYSPWWWGGFYDGGYDCFYDPWFLGGPYHHHHVYLEGRDPGNVLAGASRGESNRLSTPRTRGTSGVAMVGGGSARMPSGTPGRSTLTPVSGFTGSGRAPVNATTVRTSAKRSDGGTTTVRTDGTSRAYSRVGSSGSRTSVSDYSRSRSSSYESGTTSRSGVSSSSSSSGSSYTGGRSSSSSYSGGSSSGGRSSSSGYSGGSSSAGRSSSTSSGGRR